MVKDIGKIEEDFNLFIKKWCGNNYPHLIDSDENDGEIFRDKLRNLMGNCNTSLVNALLFMEWGYKACEKSMNIQKAKDEFVKIYLGVDLRK